MIIAAAKTGVTKANIRIVKNKDMDKKGNKTLLFLKPGILRVLLVINKLVKLIVVLTPAKITETMATSWPPIPVNLTLEEKGVTKVQPLIVKVLSEHLVKKTFLLLLAEYLEAENQKLSEFFKTNDHKKFLVL